MVLGFCIPVTADPTLSQCAEIQIIAFGVGISSANFFQRRLNSLSSIAFIGEPCPINNTGILFLVIWFVIMLGWLWVIMDVHFSSLKLSESELIQYLCPVGFGPSSKICPRWLPHFLHATSVRCIPRLLSSLNSTASFLAS